MRLVVIDGQGGGIGRALIERLRERLPEQELLCVGTNALATSAMLRAGASAGATGENAVCVTAAQADLILGPIGIVLADSMMGEITPRMAAAVAASPAGKLLVPVARCSAYVCGTGGIALQRLLEDAVENAVARVERNKGNGCP